MQGEEEVGERDNGERDRGVEKNMKREEKRLCGRKNTLLEKFQLETGLINQSTSNIIQGFHFLSYYKFKNHYNEVLLILTVTNQN